MHFLLLAVPDQILMAFWLNSRLRTVHFLFLAVPDQILITFQIRSYHTRPHPHYFLIKLWSRTVHFLFLAVPYKTRSSFPFNDILIKNSAFPAPGCPRPYPSYFFLRIVYFLRLARPKPDPHHFLFKFWSRVALLSQTRSSSLILMKTCSWLSYTKSWSPFDAYQELCISCS